MYVAEADGVPEYNGTITSEKRLVAVKFLCHDASIKERYIMYDLIKYPEKNMTMVHV